MKPIPVNNKYLISIQRPYLWLVSAMVVIMVLSLLFWLTFDYGRKTGGFYLSETESQIELLEAEIAELQKQNELLNREKTKLARDHSIEKDASSQVTKTLSDKQTQLLEMKEELTFYRNIVAPSNSKRTIVIKKIDFKSAADGLYTYKVTLNHEGGKLGAISRGMVEFSVEGEFADGKIERLDWSKVSTTQTTKQQRFGFKFFQDFEGSIRFPEGFKPISIYVRVLPSSSQIPKVDEVFAWETLISGGEQENVGQTENKTDQN
ncbi:MAG: kinetochore protein SPC24 [Gammaproteobacteria bacterium]|nr:kinetochore protein SPC24 [Gammaproteobacteria bacterium]